VILLSHFVDLLAKIRWCRSYWKKKTAWAKKMRLDSKLCCGASHQYYGVNTSKLRSQFLAFYSHLLFKKKIFTRLVFILVIRFKAFFHCWEPCEAPETKISPYLSSCFNYPMGVRYCRDFKAHCFRAVDEVQVACYRILNSLYSLGTGKGAFLER